jgi:hypothetical protein
MLDAQLLAAAPQRTAKQRGAARERLKAERAQPAAGAPRTFARCCRHELTNLESAL